VRHARETNELLKVACDELGAIVGDDSRLRFPKHFDVGLALDSRRSQCSMKRLNPSRTLNK
jgi:hypothetical protein